MQKQKIGWIGLGVMGYSMANNLLKSDYELYVFTRTKSKSEKICKRGARWLDSPGEIANAVDVIITMVGYPKDVEEVYFGPNGIFGKVKSGTVLIDMTTSCPELAIKISKKASELNADSLDAPVSGGDIGARNASLAIMCGGKKDIFDKIFPIFESVGKNIQFFGEAGSGQRVKLSNQIVIASTMIGVVEALVYAERTGLNLKKVIELVGKGAAGCWSINELGPRMAEGNFEPGFYVKHFIKDMEIALQDSKKLGLDLKGLNLVKKLYDQVNALGYGEKGTQVLYQAVKQLNKESDTTP